MCTDFEKNIKESLTGILSREHDAVYHNTIALSSSWLHSIVSNCKSLLVAFKHLKIFKSPNIQRGK